MLNRFAMLIPLVTTSILLGQDSVAHSDPFAHHAPNAIMNNRPYPVELIATLENKTIGTVSLMFRTNQSETYREIHLDGEYGRYSYSIPVEMLSGDTLTYFFLVAMKDYGLWAWPLDPDGRIRPFMVALLPPDEYLRRR